MKADIKSPNSIKGSLKGEVNVVDAPVKPTDKKRKFPGSTTKRGYGPVMNPSLKNTMSSVVGGAGEASLPASAPTPTGGVAASGGGGGTGAVMASVEGGVCLESTHMFFNFLESIATDENTDILESIVEAYCVLNNIPLDFE